ncbi:MULTISPECIES: LysR family transcriptional regulator [unclassified Corallococcus]|uniref:LysR family transcriptional regulator n=1 Tax=unclassified Corallococcus TaxID=2685029 RepID=UPI001A8C943C|nr:MULTISPECIES: LysR family transcriptional regulator [unclassified Corallococcus]MBN9686473.1 LysR family transcriptional regulator [Corallococcus sp. NCSPR001]WAS82099.1 LysR family transcriptional regulator [Corallococcus sp. NCRR]
MTLIQEPLAGLGAFVRTLETGSFSAAARALGVSPSAVSKTVARLEGRLGVLLLQRGTRRLQPTPEGLSLFERGQRIVAELEAAQDELRESKGPRGPLHVTAPMDLGRHWLVPRLPAFLAAYPRVQCALGLTDRFIDLVEERVDVGLRMGESADTRLVRRRLGESRAVICASPAYLRRHGTPRKVADLQRHACLAYLRGGQRIPWRLDGKEVEVPGPFASDNNEALLTLAQEGVGIARIPEFVATQALASGRLKVVLGEVHSPGPDVFVVYPERRHLSPRVRVFVDFVADAFARDEARPGTKPRPRGDRGQ